MERKDRSSLPLYSGEKPARHQFGTYFRGERRPSDVEDRASLQIDSTDGFTADWFFMAFCRRGFACGKPAPSPAPGIPTDRAASP
jgi:hypothetical protein